MMRLRAYIAMLVVMLALDMVWLAKVGDAVYRPRLGALVRTEPILWAAAAFYLVYVAGAYFFAVRSARSWRHAAALGALFGFFAYATYDLTNLATLQGWSVLVSFLDIGWGALLTAIAATAGYFAQGRRVI